MKNSMRAAFLCRRFTVLTIGVFFYEKKIESLYFVYFMPDCTVLVAMEFTYYLFLREKKVNILKLRSQVIDIFINHVSVIVSGSRG